MPEIQMPEGKYFSLSGAIKSTSGGQTRALLLRNRLLVQQAGIEPTLLTFDGSPDYPRTRAALREQGQLVDSMRLLNIFEWYRENSFDDLEPLGEALPEFDRCDAIDEPHPDGTVHRTRYWNSRTRQEFTQDFRRPDGSVYARLPAGDPVENLGRPVTLVNSKGDPVARWPDLGGWHQHWIRELTPVGERALIISDSRAELPHVVGLSTDHQFHLVHVIHNIHMAGQRRWDSPFKLSHAPVLEAIRELDGLVTLTSRQGDDIADRLGRTTNLYVVPNPVESPPRPKPLPQRERARFAVVARLGHQKQLEHAVRAFAIVMGQEPEATLDIYGDGTLRSLLAEEISKHGLEKSVVLRGFDPRARETLWTATGLLMTSRFEGYPLATLEAMSHGCPVISYDIKYGPREQISNGVDGYLVKSGDLQGMADRIVELIRNPELTAKMSEAAYEKALHHDHRAFLKDWRNVLESVIAKKECRTTLESVTLRVSRLGYVRAVQIPSRLARNRLLARLAPQQAASGAFRASRKMEFAGRLRVEGHSPSATLDDAVVTLEAVSHSSGDIVAIPLTVHRSGSVFRLTARFDIEDVFGAMKDGARSARLRLRLVWENSSWEETLSRPRRLAPNYEVSFSSSGEVSLLRGRGTPG